LLTHFFAMLWDIDLIFGMWMYNDKLQINFTFCSGSMIFGRVMALGLWNLAKYLVVTTFFSLCLEILTWCLVYECIMLSYRSSLHFVPLQWFLAELWPLDFEIWLNIYLSPLFFAMLGDIDLIFGVWVYNDELQIKFTFRSAPNDFWSSYGPWTLKFGQIFSCHHFISLWFEILTWFLVWECISYRSTLKFICYS
jgi:hypothetical protein